MPPERPHFTSTINKWWKIRTSWIWNHGTEVKLELGEGNIWRCNHCPSNSPKTFDVCTTSNQAKHLSIIHGIYETGTISTNQKTIQETLHSRKPSFETAVLRKLIVEWVIDRRHAFNESEAESFRRIIKYLKPEAIENFPTSANTIQRDCIKYFHQARDIMTELLSTARSQIHISFDIWTSPNHRHMIAITAHWTDVNYMV